MLKLARQILFIPILCLIVQCAQIVPLSGGKRDIVPPKLLESIPAHNNIRFNADEIVLRFDEFVQIKDLSNQLIVGPKLKTSPEVTAEGKKIRIKLKKEELLPNTTYRLRFGNSIADINESNSIKDFEYVFSTGDLIDTLEIKGLIRDAYSNNPVSEVLVGLYSDENDSDSIVYKKEANYITRTESTGEFNFKNLPVQTYKMFAFTDKNKNGLYDGETERVAFRGPKVALSKDTAVTLQLFQEEPSKTFIKRTASPYYGLSQLFLNKKSKIELKPLFSKDESNVSEIGKGKERDTISFFYKDVNDSLRMILKIEGSNKPDTIKLKLPKNNPAKKRFKTINSNISGSSLALNGKIQFSFLTWMDTLSSDLKRVTLSSKEDSLITVQPLLGKWINVNTFELLAKLKEGITYSLKIDTNAFFDLKHVSNDSAKFNFTTQSRSEFGKLTLKLLLNKKQSYVLQLLNEQSIVVRERAVSFSLSSSNAVSLEFTDVPPGIYLAKLVFDDNENKKWDSGHLIRQQQPERVIIHTKQLKVISDWEVEEEIQFKE